MKKRSIGEIILNILLGIIAALLIVAIAGYFIMKEVILPRYTQKLAEQGRGEIAQVVEENANLGSLASLGSLLSDRGVMNFLKNIDRDSAKSVLEVLDTLDQEYSEAEAPSDNAGSASDPWKVMDRLYVPAQTPAPAPSEPQPSAQPQKQPSASSGASGSTAYERIAAVATADEISDGLKIISKLDMGYVSSLTAGGLTSEEKKELKAYVQSVLTSAEISRAMSLYRAYSKYL